MTLTNRQECKIKSDWSHGDHDYTIIKLLRPDKTEYYLTEKELHLVWCELHLYVNDEYKKLGFKRIYYDCLNYPHHIMNLDCKHEDYELVDTGARIGRCLNCDWVMWESLF